MFSGDERGPGRGRFSDAKEEKRSIEAALKYDELIHLIAKAEDGDRIAEFNLGHCYEQRGDAEYAVKYYQKSASKGHAPAQFNLGLCQLNGNGCDKDIEQAVDWFRKAASQNHVKAQVNVAFLLLNGKGCIKNEKEAVSWLEKAAANGDAIAKKYLQKKSNLNPASEIKSSHTGRYSVTQQPEFSGRRNEILDLSKNSYERSTPSLTCILL